MLEAPVHGTSDRDSGVSASSRGAFSSVLRRPERFLGCLFALAESSVPASILHVDARLPSTREGGNEQATRVRNRAGPYPTTRLEAAMRRTLFIFALTALAACSGDSSTDPNASVAGTYTLRTVNGSPLPYIILQSGANKYEITDDAISLTDGGTWTEIGHDRTTTNGQVTTSSITDAGTYTRNGTAITLNSPTNGPISGSVSGGTLTLTDLGVAAVYAK
jgi:hypothetical protein